MKGSFMSDTETVEPEEKAPAAKLTPDERRERVRAARAAKVAAAFEGKHFTYVEAVSLAADERYIDVTGNKGRHGHKIRNDETGEELTVGPASLTKLAEDFNGIVLPEKPKRGRKTTEDVDEDVEDEPPVI